MKEKKEKRVRLSMKLLWQSLSDFMEETKEDKKITYKTVKDFLYFVEEQMKPLKP